MKKDPLRRVPCGCCYSVSENGQQLVVHRLSAGDVVIPESVAEVVLGVALLKISQVLEIGLQCRHEGLYLSLCESDCARHRSAPRLDEAGIDFECRQLVRCRGIVADHVCEPRYCRNRIVEVSNGRAGQRLGLPSELKRYASTPILSTPIMKAQTMKSS